MKKRLSLFVFLWLFTGIAFAATDPINLLQGAANQMISALKQNQASLKSNPKVSYNIVIKYLVPLVDQQTMSQAVVGRTAWNSATSQQKQQFMAQFRMLVIRTYAAAMAQFKEEKVIFKPIRGGSVGKNFVQVQSYISQTNGNNIPVSYNLSRTGSSWKVVDFSVDGISMVQSFHAQFAGILSNGGMNVLLKTLSQHNQAK